MTPYHQLHNMGLKVLIIFGFKATRINYWHHTSNSTGFYNPANSLILRNGFRQIQFSTQNTTCADKITLIVTSIRKCLVRHTLLNRCMYKFASLG